MKTITAIATCINLFLGAISILVLVNFVFYIDEYRFPLEGFGWGYKSALNYVILAVAGIVIAGLAAYFYRILNGVKQLLASICFLVVQLFVFIFI